jgi:hypothetical protein
MSSLQAYLLRAVGSREHKSRTRYGGDISLNMADIYSIRSHQQDLMEEKMRLINKGVNKLHQDRLNAKETLVVLDTGHTAFEIGDLMLSEKRNLRSGLNIPSAAANLTPRNSTN